MSHAWSSRRAGSAAACLPCGRRRGPAVVALVAQVGQHRQDQEARRTAANSSQDKGRRAGRHAAADTQRRRRRARLLRQRSRPTRSTRRGRSRARAAAAVFDRGRFRPPSPASGRPGRRHVVEEHQAAGNRFDHDVEVAHHDVRVAERDREVLERDVVVGAATDADPVAGGTDLAVLGRVVPLGRLVTFWTRQRITRSAPVSPSSRRRRRCARSGRPAVRRTRARGCAARRPSAPCSAGRAARCSRAFLRLRAATRTDGRSP